MNTLRDPFPRAQRSYDRMEPREVIAEDWPTSALRKVVTDTQVEQFIETLATEGVMYDELGFPKNAGSIYIAVAQQWVRDKEKVGELIGPTFWQWAKSAAQLAEYGKPDVMPSLFVTQAG